MAPSKEDRQSRRLELKNIRLNATLAILIANKTLGCVVPLKDYSRTGLGVYSKFKVEIETLVRLSFENMNYPPLSGKVVWCGSAAFDSGAPATYPFRVGIEFTPGDDAAREAQMAIFTHIAGLLGDKV